MAFFRDVLLGGMAYKALKRSNPPSVVPPPKHTLVGLKHRGLGSNWTVSYVHDDRPQSVISFTVSKGITSRTEGWGKWLFHWN